MLQHHVSLLPQTRFGEDHHGNSSHGAVQLLYSAKNESELIFKVCHTRGMSVLALINVICLFSACSALTLAVDVMFFCAHVRVLLQDKLDRMCGGFGQVHAQYFVTRNSKDDVSLNVQSEWDYYTSTPYSWRVNLWHFPNSALNGVKFSRMASPYGLVLTDEVCEILLLKYFLSMVSCITKDPVPTTNTTHTAENMFHCVWCWWLDMIRTHTCIHGHGTLHAT